MSGGDSSSGQLPLSANPTLYWHISACAAAFIFSIVFTLRPVRLHRYVSLSMASAPVVSVGALLGARIIDLVAVLKAIRGDGHLQPYTVVILFQTLAYLCLSLNETGVLRAISLAIVARAGNSYIKLFTYTFLLSSLLTIFTSNDIVILTITPIVCHLAEDTKLDPLPLLFAQFTAANTLSTIFFFSNSTNIIISYAFQLSFWDYLEWMFFPTVAAGTALFASLFVTFRTQIRAQQRLEQQRQRLSTHSPVLYEIMDRNDVIPSSRLAAATLTIFVLCLAGIICGPLVGIEPWLICLVFGSLTIALDIVYDVYHSYPQVKLQRFCKVCENVPFEAAPFILGMFVLIEALNVIQVIGPISQILAQTCASYGVAFTVCFMLLLSMVCCNLISSQPMTIFFVSILEHPAFMSTLSTVTGETQARRLMRASIYAVLMGSNFGANITFIGALAGILWRTILMVSFNLNVSPKKFFRVGASCMLSVAVCSGSTLLVELYSES